MGETCWFVWVDPVSGEVRVGGGCRLRDDGDSVDGSSGVAAVSTDRGCRGSLEGRENIGYRDTLVTVEATASGLS